MIVLLAKWGKKIFAINETTNCPYAADHPELQKFMGESLQDRREMRNFLEDINQKVQVDSKVTARMEGKLDLLLQGARVRWNAGLIPPDAKKE